MGLMVLKKLQSGPFYCLCEATSWASSMTMVLSMGSSSPPLRLIMSDQILRAWSRRFDRLTYLTANFLQTRDQKNLHGISTNHLG
ncbi:hypothetical protein CEXT_350761 [Caerostris extrusa]|uniref:Uncharacterized protein n=1 Tax=Caerostris extrusa TaxID=172846 RepID=A0AAV4VUY7_CAEEX|nr:hypothetical protein CEXT_350761 [Caerostris extrusa]